MTPKCNVCGKVFEAESSLDQHISAVHSSRQQASPKIKRSRLIYFLIIVAVFSLGFFSYNAITGPGPYDDFAKCLSDKGAVFYGAFWCPHCNDQKKLFGKSMKYIDYVECSSPDKRAQTPVCVDEKIEGYPTWKFADGSVITGFVSLQELGVKTGCKMD